MESTGNINSKYPNWLPPLVEFNNYGDWGIYINALYQFYIDDFKRSPIIIGDRTVRNRREPMILGKDASFWHILGEEETQKNDGTFRRHERVRWPKAIIIHRNDNKIKLWSETRNAKKRFHLWFNDEYLVVIEERSDYFLFITAFVTDWNHEVRKLEKRFKDNGSEPL